VCPICGTTLFDHPTLRAKVGIGLVPVAVCPTDGAFWFNRWGPTPMAADVLVPVEA
jgi:hypothetical protein